MKAVLVLGLAALVAASGGPSHHFNDCQYGARCDSNGQVHDRFQNSDYHFSWIPFPKRKYPWKEANEYCRSLGPKWQGVSIESRKEDDYLDAVVARARQAYFWTAGYFDGKQWIWIPDGKPFTFTDWSRTGGANRPQPDNREGNEFCMAVLNNFYKDGIKWHDIACYHEKPIICERPRSGPSGGGSGSGGRGPIGGSGGSVHIRDPYQSHSSYGGQSGYGHVGSHSQSGYSHGGSQSQSGYGHVGSHSQSGYSHGGSHSQSGYSHGGSYNPSSYSHGGSYKPSGYSHGGSYKPSGYSHGGSYKPSGYGYGGSYSYPGYRYSGRGSGHGNSGRGGGSRYGNSYGGYGYAYIG